MGGVEVVRVDVGASADACRSPMVVLAVAVGMGGVRTAAVGGVVTEPLGVAVVGIAVSDFAGSPVVVAFVVVVVVVVVGRMVAVVAVVGCAELDVDCAVVAGFDVVSGPIVAFGFVGMAGVPRMAVVAVGFFGVAGGSATRSDDDVGPTAFDVAVVSEVSGKTGQRCPVVTSPANCTVVFSVARTEATGVRTVRAVPVCGLRVTADAGPASNARARVPPAA